MPAKTFSIDFDKSSLKSFNKMMKEVQDRSNRSNKSIVREATFHFLRSARAQTPKAPKMVKRPDWETVKDKLILEKGYKYVVYRYDKRGVKLPYYARTKQQRDRIRKIKRHGLAGQVWGGATQRAGRSGGVRSGLKGLSKRFSGYRQGGNKNSFFIEVSNKVSYITKIVSPDKMNRALKKAQNSMYKNFKKRYGRF